MQEYARPSPSVPSNRIRLSIGVLILLFAAVAVAVAFFWLRNGSEGSNKTLTEGETAPAFALPDAGGQMVSPSDFQGKPVLLYFSMGYG